MKTREPGYYWVRRGSRWIAAHWVLLGDSIGWAMPGATTIFPDCYFDEIDERRITRPE